MSIPRVLEPEVMDTEQDAVEYDSMDFTEVNSGFAEKAVALAPKTGVLLDLGTGTARIPILMLQKAGKKELGVHAVDLSAEMLKLARKNIDAAGLSSRVVVHLLDAKELPFDEESYDMVISNSIVHHIPEPLGFFKEVRRVVKKEGGIFIMDLLRPESMDQVERLVRMYAGDDNVYQQKLFRDSLCAALSIPEVKELVEAAGIHHVSISLASDRHWSIERASR